MMQSRVLLAAILVLAVSPTRGAAETHTYEHDGEPLFSVTFPDSWYVDTDFYDEARAAGVAKGDDPSLRIVEAMPDDDTKLWFGIWVVPRASTLERGLEYVASLDGDLFTDVEATEPKAVKLGEMTARTFYGTAQRLGEAVEFAVALFEPRSGVIGIALYVGRPQTWEKHQADLEAIVDSLAPAGS